LSQIYRESSIDIADTATFPAETACEVVKLRPAKVGSTEVEAEVRVEDTVKVETADTFKAVGDPGKPACACACAVLVDVTIDPACACAHAVECMREVAG
jgi:hypothetical protein